MWISSHKKVVPVPSSLPLASCVTLGILRNNSEFLLLLMQNKDNNSTYLVLLAEHIFHATGLQLAQCLAYGRDQQPFSAKGQIVNILGFRGQAVSLIATQTVTLA